MRTTALTAHAVRDFAKRVGIREFFTFARNCSFAIYPTRESIKITLDTTYHPISRANLNRYVAAFNAWPSNKFMRPSDFPRELRQNSYMARILPEVRNERILTEIESDLNSLIQDKTTTSKALILARLGQGQFRDDLLEREACCYVTGVSDIRLLRASHIKPWRSSSDQERLDPENGLLLTPNYDHLFDKHLLTFTDSGQILISKSIDPQELSVLGIDPNIVGRPLSESQRTYMKFHRSDFKHLEERNAR